MPTNNSSPAPTSATLRDQLLELERRSDQCRYDAELARVEAYDLEREADGLDDQIGPLREQLAAGRFVDLLGQHSALFAHRSIYIPTEDGEHWLTNGHVAVRVPSKPDAEETMKAESREAAVKFMRDADHQPAELDSVERDSEDFVYYSGHEFDSRYHALLTEHSDSLTIKLDGDRTCLYGIDADGASVGVVMGRTP